MGVIGGVRERGFEEQGGFLEGFVVETSVGGCC